MVVLCGFLVVGMVIVVWLMVGMWNGLCEIICRLDNILKIVNILKSNLETDRLLELLEKARNKCLDK